MTLRGPTWLVLASCLSVSGCDAVLGDSFDMADYRGRYAGPAVVDVRVGEEVRPSLHGEGEVRIEPFVSGTRARARFEIRFDDRALFLFQGPYDSSGWSLTAIEDDAFRLQVDPAGRITGSFSGPGLEIDVDGELRSHLCIVGIDIEYLRETAGIPAGTRISMEFVLNRS